jgi:glutaredoxin
LDRRRAIHDRELTHFVNPATLFRRFDPREARVRNKFYTIPTCPHCRTARDYLVGKGVDFIEFDVSTDLVALRAMLTMTARAEVPAIIAGDSAVVGFNPESWDALLKRTEELQTQDPYRLPESLGPDPFDGVD